MEVCSLNTSARGHPSAWAPSAGGMGGSGTHDCDGGVCVYAFAAVSPCASKTRRLRRMSTRPA